MNIEIKELILRQRIAAGLFAMLFIVFLAGDVWVWKGAMLNTLGAWVAEEGGEEASTQDCMLSHRVSSNQIQRILNPKFRMSVRF